MNKSIINISSTQQVEFENLAENFKIKAGYKWLQPNAIPRGTQRGQVFILDRVFAAFSYNVKNEDLPLRLFLWLF
jgi:hypothetical protein